MLPQALNMEGVPTWEDAHLLAGVETALIGRLPFFIRVLVKFVGTNDRGTDERAFARVHEQF